MLFFGWGCTLGPKYRRPAVAVPSDWKTKEVTSTSILPHFKSWWEVFEDPTLSSLEKEVVRCNRDLNVALHRVAEARALAGVSRADLYPQLNLQPQYQNTIELLFFPIPGAQDIKRIHELTYSLPLNMSYELDLWGKLRNKYGSALDNAEAKEAAYCTTLITLTTDLAISYFNLRAFDAQLEILQETIEVDKRDVELVEMRNQKGLVGLIDVANVQQVLFQDEASYSEALRLRTLEENKIATLMGRPASCFCLSRKPLREEPPKIPVGLPSTILCHRPDIRDAERTAASQHALIGVAYASFFPSLTLSGAVGFLSPRIGDFLTWPSRLWAYGVNASETVFDGDRNCENLNASWARFGQASASYQKTVLIALQEVEDALNNIEREDVQANRLQNSLKAAKLATNLAEERYQRGLTNYLEVAQYKKTELEAATTLTELQGLRFHSTIQFIKAIGGQSW